MKIFLCLFLFLAVSLPASADLNPPPLRFAKLRNPIVLVHGATMKGSSLDIGFLHYGEYFRKLPAFLGSTGTPVRVVELTTDSSIGERAAVLKNFLETDMKGQMVNLICHSLGGLDARYAASVLQANQIASITTIGTPHHGTPLADWAVRQKQKHTAWYWFFRLVGYDMEQRRFLPELSTEYMATTFNPRVPNVPDVKYYSVQTRASFARRNMSYLLWLTARWLEGEKSPMAANGHDGLVPFDSQAWGRVVSTGEFDHLAQINHHEWRYEDQSEQVYQSYSEMYGNLFKEGL